MAVEVCEQGTAPFYYSTKGDTQNVALNHGIRLTGAMTKDDIARFCSEHDVKCIVNAAHPFAGNLHKAIAEAGIPVIRVETRQMASEPADGVVWADDFADAVNKLLQDRPARLLALTGVNSIASLRDYWQNGHDTIFRILHREDSLRKASEAGFPPDKLVFYNESCTLPSVDEELHLMQQVGCDAIITKQSGEAGGFSAKVEAARALGIKVYAVKPPTLPSEWIVVTGRHTLRRELERIVPAFFPLVTGLTTGVCATAAAKAALLTLVSPSFRSTPAAGESVTVTIPDGEEVVVPVSFKSRGVAAVVKDFSSDPDVTRGCCIVARVALRPASSPSAPVVRFLQGRGVGRVTLPGLGIPVGEPAINPTPRRMMEKELRALTNDDVDVTIEVEHGEEIALHTFNPRLGVVGGISIIGTSGIVRPMSHEAAVESIGRELQVVRQTGQKTIALAMGRAGEEFLQSVRPELKVVLCGNFIGDTLQRAHSLGFREAVMALGIGKAVKLAEGHLDTHSHKVAINKNFIAEVAMETCGADAATAVQHITMARELWSSMLPAFFERIRQLCVAHCSDAFPEGNVEILLIKE